MKCNVCGGEIPAGAAMCPICGAPAPMGDAAPQTPQAPMGGYPMQDGNAAPVNPFGADPAQQPAQNFGGYDPNQPMTDPYAQNMGVPAPVAPKKSNTGLIIGIIVGVAVIAALVIMWVLGVFGGGGGKDGTYKLYSAKAYGINVDHDSLETFGLDSSKYSIKVSGSKATLDMAGNSASCDINFSGDTVTLSGDGQSLSGTYNSSDGTITLSVSGIEMTFKK